MPLLGPRLTQSACEHSRLARSKVIPVRELSSDERPEHSSNGLVRPRFCVLLASSGETAFWQ